MPSSNKIVAQDWRERAIAEYISAAHCSNAVTLMIQSGMSLDYIEDGLALVSQELRHAEESFELSIELGSKWESLEINPKSFQYSHDAQKSAVSKLAHLCARFFCCAEYVGSNLQQKMLENAKQPRAILLLTTIVNDEKEHTSIGWGLIEELVPRLNRLEISELKAMIPKYIDEIESYYNSKHTYSSEELSWGLLNGSDYQQISSKSLRVVEEKFSKLALIDRKSEVRSLAQDRHSSTEVNL